MAEVYLARGTDPERLVVVKKLRAPLAVESEYVRMFLAEGRLALTLRHPNVVEVYEIGEDAGQCYIAMEYLHGHDLRETMARMVERHALVQLDQALSVVRAVAAGLHYTHERTGADGEMLGIVHRDVSPHNVLLTFDGRVKLVDFGIAKTTSQETRTRTGVLKGKVAYMAPEQAMGLAIDRRSDLFCLGILLWEMTTGRRLFRRRTELETLNAVAQDRPPRPSRIVAGYPRDLERVIMKALARSREDRWATAGELIEAIDEVARRHKLTLGPEPVRALISVAFADELAAWRAVQPFGISLADHLVAQNDRETTRANDTDLDTEDDRDMLPVPSFERTRYEHPARRRRWWWPVLAGAVVASGVAVAWLVARHDGEPAATDAAVRDPAGPAPAGSSTALRSERQSPIERSEELGGGDPAGSAGGAGGKAPRGIEGSGDFDGSAGGAGGKAAAAEPAPPTLGSAAAVTGVGIGPATAPAPSAAKESPSRAAGSEGAGAPARDPAHRQSTARPPVRPRPSMPSRAAEHKTMAPPPSTSLAPPPARPVSDDPPVKPPPVKPPSKPTPADLDKLP